MTSCTIKWRGHKLPHLDKTFNIKGVRIEKGKEIDVPATVAGSLKRDYPDSVEIVKGEPVEPGSSGDPVARLKAAKRDLRTDVIGLFADVPVLPGDMRKALSNCAKDVDPRTLVPADLRAYAALWCRLSGRDELAQKLLAADGG